MDKIKFTEAIKGWRFEVSSEAERKAAEMSGETYVPQTELLGEYPPEELVLGKDLEDSITLMTAEGVRVSDSFLKTCERMKLNRYTVAALADKVNAANGWIECGDLPGDTTREKKLRLTALAERPKINLDRTVMESDLSECEMTQITIGGKQLLGPGKTLNDRNRIYQPDFVGTLRSLIETGIKQKTGVDAKVEVTDITTEGADYNSAAYTLECGSEEDAQKVLKEAFGIIDPESLKPKWIADPEANGKRAVRYGFCFVDSIE